MEIIAQIIGFIALALAVGGYQVNKRKKLILLHMAASTLFAIHFLMLGAFTGSAMNAINVAKNYIFSNKYDKTWARSDWWLVSFVIVFVVVGLLTWDGLKTLLPITGMVTGAIAFWLKSTTYIRILALIAPPCWFTYNYIVGSIPGMIVEILIFSSIVIAMVRYDILKLKHIAKK